MSRTILILISLNIMLKDTFISGSLNKHRINVYAFCILQVFILRFKCIKHKVELNVVLALFLYNVSLLKDSSIVS